MICRPFSTATPPGPGATSMTTGLPASTGTSRNTMNCRPSCQPSDAFQPPAEPTASGPSVFVPLRSVKTEFCSAVASGSAWP